MVSATGSFLCTLQRQIEQGAPVDVFLSASPAPMDALLSEKLILADTRKDLVRNSVVLIVPKDRAGIRSFPDLARSGVKVIAIGDPPCVPAGKYAQEVLTHFGLFDSLKPKFVFAKDVRQVLTYAETGNADAGIVYATDARVSTRVRVFATAPEDSHSPVLYPVAVVARSKNPQAAENLEDSLLGPKSAAVFASDGFSPPVTEPSAVRPEKNPPQGKKPSENEVLTVDNGWPSVYFPVNREVRNEGGDFL
jgi:molybdate transport system substrate-binding protein